jgi:uncharacterized protein
MDSQPDLGQAQQYALHRLEHELSPGLLYHGLWHTRDDVVPAVEWLAGREGLPGEARGLLLTAAWFHDLGFIEQPAAHEWIGARLASEALPGFGFSSAQVEIVRSAILATIIPQAPTTLLESILADADLDVLGRADFMLRNGHLRQELAFFGEHYSDAAWYSRQLKFLEAHTYFTASARARRAAGQLSNVAQLRRIVDGLDPEH